MKKILGVIFFASTGISSVQALCSTYKDKTTCDIFGKPMCRWDGAGQCVAGNKPDAKQSTIEDKPFTFELTRKKPEPEKPSKESVDDLPPPE